MSTTTPPVRVRAMAQWPENPHLSLSRRQNLSLCPTLVVKMQRPENRLVLEGKNDISTNFLFKWNGFICVYPLRLKLKIIVKSKLIEVLLRFLKIFFLKSPHLSSYFIKSCKSLLVFPQPVGDIFSLSSIITDFILNNYRLGVC